MTAGTARAQVVTAGTARAQVVTAGTARAQVAAWALCPEVGAHSKLLFDNICLEFRVISTLLKISEVLKHVGLSFLAKTK